VSEEADALAEMARNRGLRLVRSRIRTPTKRGFGKYGLTDAKGAKLLGLDGKQPSASAEEVETYLRKGLVSDWAGSLGVDPPRVRKPRAAPKPTAPPKPELRSARPGDAEAIVALAGLLGHELDAAGVARRLKALKPPQLVATIGSTIVGLCGLDRQTHLHRNAPVGRLTILVVAEEARGQGLGRMLVDEALLRLAKLDCELVEVTSNNRLTGAHRFYLHLGFEQRSQRFAKAL
jgi:ribosomal protein S18 acetylase RimI-like enzyme